MLEFGGAAVRLAVGDVAEVAAGLELDAAIVHAVIDVESAGAGFLSDGRPKILFEARQFYLLTRGRYGTSNISSPVWDRSLYGAAGAHQYDRLAKALKLDREMALRSASWGAPQIMGNNFALCGFADVFTMVAAFQEGERRQLDALAVFLKRARLDRPLRKKPPDFAEFARGYNGPGYAANAYDVKLAAAWRKWSGKAPRPNPAPRTIPEVHYATLQLGSTGPEVRALQARLAARGFDVAADGDFGPETLAAVVAVQKQHRLVRLVPDGIVGPNTRQAIWGKI